LYLMPLPVHCLSAWQDLLPLLFPASFDLRLPGLCFCFLKIKETGKVKSNKEQSDHSNFKCFRSRRCIG
jgi:hypothetical protein